MRPRFLPPPLPEAWPTVELHELVRDYPELLAPLRERGLLVGAHGTKTLGDLGGVSGRTLETLSGAVAWRA